MSFFILVAKLLIGLFCAWFVWGDYRLGHAGARLCCDVYCCLVILVQKSKAHTETDAKPLQPKSGPIQLPSCVLP
jgi:hypothetical protein